MYWIAFYQCILQVLGCEADKNLINWINAYEQYASNSGWAWFYKDVAIITDKPLSNTFDERGRLHHDTQPAIIYSDGYGLSSWHGVRITEDIINRNFTVVDIDKEGNAEVRRAMIEIYGQAEYLLDSNAELIHSDGFGDLYRKEIPNDEPLVMLKVVNSTPEPDGSYKDYFLRVPPNFQIAGEAWAWINHLEPNSFEILAES